MRVWRQCGGATLTCVAALTALGLLLPAVGRPQTITFMPPTWQAIGPSRIPNAHACDNAAEAALPAAGKLQAFAIDLGQPSVMYTGGGAGPGNSGPYSNGGLYKTTDGGAHWAPVINGLTDRYVGSLWLDQTQPGTLLASTWFDGIFRSTDGGSSWHNVRPFSTTSIVQRGAVLLAGAADGIVTSSDSGATWTTLKATTSPVRTLRCNAAACYAGLQDGSVLAQVAPDPSWQNVLAGFPGSTAWDIALDPVNASPVIVVRNNSGQLENLISRNAGATWSDLPLPAPQPGVACAGSGLTQVIAFDTVDPNLVYSGFGGSVWVSHNAAASWTPVHLFEDLRLIYPLPGQTGKVVAGGDHGIYLSSDSGATWSSLNGNISNTLLTHLAVSGTDVLTAVQDFSPILTFDDGASWLQLSGSHPPAGEDGVVAIHPANPLYRYAFTTGGFWYSSDGGKNFFNDNANLPYTEFGFNGATDYIAFAPDAPEHLYIVGSTVFESLDYGVHWRRTGWPIPAPSFVVVDPGDAQTLFVGSWTQATTTGAVFFSHDGGATWNQSVLPSSARRPVSLSVDPRDSKTVLLGMAEPAGVPGGGVLLSTDGGATFVSDIQGLTTRPALAPYYAPSVKFAPPTLPHIAVAATSSGLYISRAGEPWTNISGDAIPYWFSAVAWTGDMLYVSTYGQGVLKTPIRAVLPIVLTPPSANIDGSGGGGFVAVSSATWGASSEAPWITVVSGALGSGSGVVGYSVASNPSQTPRVGSILIGGARFTVTQSGATPAPAVLSIAKTHTGSFFQRQIGATYTITVSNAAGAGPTSGAVTVTEMLPSALALVSMAGTGWTCPSLGPTCTRSDVLAPGASYPVITVTVNVAADATLLTNTVTVSGGGSATASATEGMMVVASESLRFVPITPCRIADTRDTAGPFGGPRMPGGVSRDFGVSSGGCGIPATARAYSLNVAIVPAGPLGYLTLWPSGQAQPLASTLNSLDGRIKSNAAIVPAGAGGAISAFASNATDLILDINGYFLPAADPSALAFYPVNPCRVADTRNAAGPFGGPALDGGHIRTFPAPSTACGIPGSARAYSLNFAAIPKGPLGYLTAWPAGQSQPPVASLNALTGTVTANAAIVPAGSGGAIDVFASNPTDLVIDINGYFAPVAPQGLSLYTVPPCRVLDSRRPPGTPPFAGSRDVGVSGGGCGIPTAGQAYVFGATVVPPSPLGYLTLWPQGQAQASVATLNALDAAITSNLAIVPTSNGNISAFASNPTYLVLDIFGYFAP